MWKVVHVDLVTVDMGLQELLSLSPTFVTAFDLVTVDMGLQELLSVSPTFVTALSVLCRVVGTRSSARV